MKTDAKRGQTISITAFLTTELLKPPVPARSLQKPFVFRLFLALSV